MREGEGGREGDREREGESETEGEKEGERGRGRNRQVSDYAMERNVYLRRCSTDRLSLCDDAT